MEFNTNTMRTENFSFQGNSSENLSNNLRITRMVRECSEELLLELKTRPDFLKEGQSFVVFSKKINDSSDYLSGISDRDRALDQTKPMQIMEVVLTRLDDENNYCLVLCSRSKKQNEYENHGKIFFNLPYDQVFEIAERIRSTNNFYQERTIFSQGGSLGV